MLDDGIEIKGHPVIVKGYRVAVPDCGSVSFPATGDGERGRDQLVMLLKRMGLREACADEEHLDLTDRHLVTIMLR